MSALELWPQTIMNTYGDPAIEIISGEGVYLTDSLGRSHIDLLAGIAVNCLGHAHPAVVSAVSQQISQLGHVSNLFASRPATSVAQELINRFSTGNPEIAATSKVFFCNSGAEANEAAFKLARSTGKRRILAAANGFHGRTMGSLAMTGQPAKQAPFHPLPPGVEFYPYGDLDYLTQLVQTNADDVAMIILEPIQGETGVVPAPDGFLAGVRTLCYEYDILFACDEVQTGVGRTGDFFAFQHERVHPDIVTMAKGLGGGLPIGACLASGKAAELLGPGAHGTTFGGNPVVCAAAEAVLKVIDESFLAEVKRKGRLLLKSVAEIPGVKQVRGRGLMLGVILEESVAKTAVSQGFDYGLILNAPAENILRLTPPLIISDSEISEATTRLTALLKELL